MEYHLSLQTGSARHPQQPMAALSLLFCHPVGSHQSEVPSVHVQPTTGGALHLTVAGTPQSLSLPVCSTFSSCGDHTLYVSTSDLSYIPNKFSSLFTAFVSASASVCSAEIDSGSTKLSFSLLHLVYTPSTFSSSPSLSLSQGRTRMRRKPALMFHRVEWQTFPPAAHSATPTTQQVATRVHPASSPPQEALTGVRTW